MTMKRIIDFLNILALCAAFGLLASCGGKSGLDPDPEPEPEPLAGVLHYTIYNDTFDDSGVPLILAEGTVDMAALSDTPLALPQPETPSDGSYAFLGWAGRYDTAGGKVWTTVPDPLTADFAASIRPGAHHETHHAGCEHSGRRT